MHTVKLRNKTSELRNKTSVHAYAHKLVPVLYFAIKHRYEFVCV